MHFKNLAADGSDDFPTADTRPQGHGQGAEEFYQVRDFQAGNKPPDTKARVMIPIDFWASLEPREKAIRLLIRLAAGWQPGLLWPV